MARTTPPSREPTLRNDGRNVDEMGWSMGFELVRLEEYINFIDSLPFGEALKHAEWLSAIQCRTLFSISYALQSADGRIPDQLTRKDMSAVKSVTQEMAQLKEQMERMLRFLEDWAESRVAMTAHADGNHRERSV
jgi:hypothetical protein